MLLFANHRLAEMLATSPSTLTGTAIEIHTGRGPCSPGRAPRRSTGEWRGSGEFPFLTVDGRKFEPAVSVTQLPRASGPASSLVATDITERARIEQELEHRVSERTADLERANRELETFAYSVSHDLRAPLPAVDGFSKILLEQYGEKHDEDGRHYLERVRAATLRMAI